MLTRWSVVAATSVCVLALSIVRPSYNWDVVGYVAACYHRDGYRGAELSERTFREIKSVVDSGHYAELTAADDYRATVARDPRSLEQQVPFYSIRIAYVEMIRWLSRVGLTYAESAFCLSALFGGLSVVVLAGLFTANRVPLLWLPLVVVSAGVLEVARASTPDALACLCILLSTLAFLRKSRASLLMASIAPLARTDLVVFSCLVAGCEFFRGKRYASVIAAATSVILYLVINRLTGHYGWLTVFNFSLIRRDPYPAALVPSTNLVDYLRVYPSAGYGVLSHSFSVVYVLASYVFLRMGRAAVRSARTQGMAVIPVAYVIAHLALFPLYEPRFFVPSAALVLVWLLAVLGNTVGAGREEESQPGNIRSASLLA